MNVANTHRSRLAASALLGALMCVAPFAAGPSRFGPMYAVVGVLAASVAALFARAGRGSVTRGRMGWVIFWLSVAVFSAAESVYYFGVGFSDDDPVIALDAMALLTGGAVAVLIASSRMGSGSEDDAK